jgi:predicted transcriptional regulator
MAFNEAVKEKLHGRHPNSLAQLKPAFTSENAREMQLKGAESKRLKREQAEALKVTADMYRRLKAEMPEVDAISIMEITMLKYLNDGEMEDASRIASLIAPYQRPKLAAIEQNVTSDVSSMSDEDLKKIVAQLGVNATPAITGEE